MKLYPETLPDKTAKLLEKIREWEGISEFYLSGGTALSLQLGHRESEDLDFFCESDFDPTRIQQGLEKLGKLSDVELQAKTFNGYIEGVKVQFLGYPYPLLEPTADYRGIRLSSVMDIACTKLQTIGMRGSKKDFVDMYAILQQMSITELLADLAIKYQQTQYNLPHIMKSLVYFADAEGQVMPRLHQNIEWEQVKEKMVEVSRTVRW